MYHITQLVYNNELNAYKGEDFTIQLEISGSTLPEEVSIFGDDGIRNQDRYGMHFLQEACQGSQREDKMEGRKIEKKITVRYIWFYARSQRLKMLPLAAVLIAARVTAADISPVY